MNPPVTHEAYSAVIERPPQIQPDQIQETAFEKRRGIGKIELRQGFAQVHVDSLADPIMESRLAVLDLIAEAGLSIDFLKLTPGGLSFVVAEAGAKLMLDKLEGANIRCEVNRDRHIVLVHAVNMRDEAGLIADVLKVAIGSGISLEHVTDMHDRMLMVVAASESIRLQEALVQLGGKPA